MRPAGLVRFPPFRLDVANACLWRGQRTIRLTPKAFAVLHCLAERPGQLVTKEMLLETVWPATVVGDAVLKVCVREIRKALRDRAEAPKYIATVHRLGYRFIAEVETGSEDRPVLVDDSAARGGPEPTRSRRIRPRTASPLVGREPALDRLQMWLDAAWRGGRQVVFVTGEPGIGKTAVIEAFLDHAAADARVFLAQGQCVETYGTSEPYLPVLDALARLCREPGGDHVVSLLRKQAPTWLVQMPWLLDAADRDLVERDLLGATRERMLRELAELVEVLAAEAPLVLVLEDLQWSDAATIDLISLIAQRREPARLLLIGTYRPVDATVAANPVGDVKRVLEARGQAHDLSLSLLAEDAVAEYLAARFPDSAVSRELAHVLHRRTEGNPLFMVSAIDDLIARGVLARREGRWDLRAALGDVELDVPESLRHMIDRQVSRLTLEEQRILAAASAAGMEFSVASVAAAIDRPVDEVDEWCSGLARQHLFLRALGPREWPDRTMTARFAFNHALHRQTLYQGLPLARRRALHQAIGEREEAAYGERAHEIAAELAAHFGEAGDDHRTVRYLQLATGTAMRRHANREAIEYLARAQGVAARLPEPDGVNSRLTLLEQQGLTHRTMGDVAAAVSDFEALSESARAHGRGRHEVRALLHLASALSWIDRARSLAAGEQALERAQTLDDPVLQAYVRGYCGVQRILVRGWRDEDALACRTAIDVARRAGDRARLSLHVGHYAHLLSHQAEYRAAARTGEEGLRLALDVADAYHYMTCQFHRAWALLHLGEWGDMRRVLDDGLLMAERNGHALWARAFRFQTAWLHIHARDFDGARSLCQRELDPAREPQLGELGGSIGLGFAHLGAKRHDAALRVFRDVSAHATGQPALMDWILLMPLELGLAETSLARREWSHAREHADALCRLAGTSGERTYLALGHRVAAEAALADGDRPAADRAIARALDALSGHEAPLAEWKVYATAAQAAASDHPARADTYWARSVAVLDRLGASLSGDPILQQKFLSDAAVQAVRRRAHPGTPRPSPATRTPRKPAR